jgi:hypothetical protein
MILITQEKDEFTGFRTIKSNMIGLTNFCAFSNVSTFYLLASAYKISDVIDLIYIEHEEGQGIISIRVISVIDKYFGYTEWPNWKDSWPMIIDGERVTLNSESSNTFENKFELKLYNLPVDVFNKICNAKEVKFSLRGINVKVEGEFNHEHLKVFQAFEQYCFGDEKEGEKLLETIKEPVIPKNIEDTPEDENVTNMSSEEKSMHENRVIDLIKNKKINDAILYYASNFKCHNDNAKMKVMEIAELYGFASIYKKYENWNLVKGCFFLFIIIAIVLFLVGTCL